MADKKKYWNINDEVYWSEDEMFQLWKDEQINKSNRTYADF